MTDAKKTENKDQNRDRGEDLAPALAPDPMKGGVDSSDAAAPGDAKGERKPKRGPVQRDKSMTEQGASASSAGLDEAVRGQTMPRQYEGDGFGDVPVQMRDKPEK